MPDMLGIYKLSALGPEMLQCSIPCVASSTQIPSIMYGASEFAEPKCRLGMNRVCP